MWVVKHVIAPSFLLPALTTLGTAIAYYAHRQLPAFWVPACTGIGVSVTMLFYHRKEKKRLSAEPKPASAAHLGMRWIYYEQDGKPTEAIPFPVCVACGLELRLPRLIFDRQGQVIPRPASVACDGCGHRVEIKAYAPELVDMAARLIWRDSRAARGI